ncbi:MAG: DMT family protein [Bacteroidia bacterium]
MRIFNTILLLTISNIFMTFAWYGHLQFHKIGFFKNLGLVGIILVSWFIALFEYAFQVPANKYGFIDNGGSFNLVELKTLQEVISLSVFVAINLLYFNGKMTWNYWLAFIFIAAAVYLVFYKQ